MHTPNDLSQSRIVLKQDSTLIAAGSAALECCASARQAHQPADGRSASRRLKACQKAGLVTRCGNVITAADSAPKASIDMAAYLRSCDCSSAAAGDGSHRVKIKVTQIRTPRNRNHTQRLPSCCQYRRALHAEHYGVVAAHIYERSAAQSAIAMQDAALAARIVQTYIVADLDRRLGQIDSAIEGAAKRGQTTIVLTAFAAQHKSREALVE